MSCWETGRKVDANPQHLVGRFDQNGVTLMIDVDRQTVIGG